MSKPRMPRVEELIKQEISMIVQKDILIPGLGFLTFTHVSVSKDLKEAKVYVSVYGTKESQETSLVKLNEERFAIYKLLKKRLCMKRIPFLEFIQDLSAEYSDQIARKLNEIKQKKK